MDTHVSMVRRYMRLCLPGLACLALLVNACAPPGPPAPTAAPTPAKPAAPTVPPKPAATTASAARPTEAPVAKPTDKTVAKAAPLDERAVADFYRGKTVRIVVGLSAGGGYDLTSRLIAKHMPAHLPGNPTIIVENRPGAGSALAANTIYATEPKDGSVIGNISPTLVLRQALGQPGVDYDAAKLQWLGSTAKDFTACLVRADVDAKTIQDTIGGKEIILATLGPGDNSHDVPAVMNATIGTRFKLVPGYDGSSKFRLAMESKEVDGFCITFISGMLVGDSDALQSGSARIIVALGDKLPDHPFLKAVPTAESLAKAEEAKTLLRTIDTPQLFNKPYFVAPGVPTDRVEALRKALAATYADPSLRADAEKAKFDISPSSGEEVDRIVQGVLGTPPALLAKLKEIAK